MRSKSPRGSVQRCGTLASFPPARPGGAGLTFRRPGPAAATKPGELASFKAVELRATDSVVTLKLRRLQESSVDVVPDRPALHAKLRRDLWNRKQLVFLHRAKDTESIALLQSYHRLIYLLPLAIIKPPFDIQESRMHLLGKLGPAAEYPYWSWSVEREARVWDQIDATGDCWLWATNIRKGYGHLVVKDRGHRHFLTAHRLVWYWLVGPIENKLELDHLCRVRRCVNPAHLEPVTHQTNQRRGWGVSGICASKRRCQNGHPFTGENLVIHSDGRRACRICETAHNRRHRVRSRAS